MQKCGREAREKGRKLPTNLGFFLDEFFDFYGNQLNYASTGKRGGGAGKGRLFVSLPVWLRRRVADC